MQNHIGEDETTDESNSIISIIHMPDAVDSVQMLSTSNVLGHCKRKILLPYQRILALIGLRSVEQSFVNYLLPLLGLILLLGGYVLRYMLCFRRDLGSQFNQEQCPGNLLYNHLMPGLLHLAGYLQALLIMRVRETERLEMLMERTFLLAAHGLEGARSIKSLVRCLWICVICSAIWVIASISCVIVVLCYNYPIDRWVSTSNLVKIILEVLLVLTTLWQDLLQATIVASYCLQVMLLFFTAILLRMKLIYHSFQPLEWAREVSECQQSLEYLNKDLSPSVSLLTLLEFAWAGSGLIKLIRQQHEASAVNCIIVSLWICISAAPVIAAAILTSAFDSIRSLGHEVRARPFVYQSTPAQDLDTLLLFTSSIRLHAKLFGFPVYSQYLFLLLAATFVIILILGQSNLL